jgi:hypothetical protein
MSCIWLGTACADVFAGGLLVLLMARLPIDTSTQPFEAISASLRDVGLRSAR